jgi:hypothetical protein
MGPWEFSEQTKQFMKDPNLVQEAYQEFRDNLARAPSLLSSEPEFSNLVASLDKAFTMTKNELKKDDASEREVAPPLLFGTKKAYRLHEWLCTQATAKQPLSDVKLQFEESTDRQLRKSRDAENSDNRASRPGGEEGE